MEKWMIVFVLPLEVWMDIFVFPWISRKEFGRLVDRIGNFKFAEHAQFYLHEWGKRSLGEIDFYKEYLYINYKRHPMVVPQTPLPENFKSLKSITIHHFDANTMHFLGRIRPLLADLELHLSIERNHFESLHIILTNMLPFLDGIHLLQCHEGTLPVARQCFGANWAKSSTKVLRAIYHLPVAMQQENINSILDWLAAQPVEHNNGNGGPKMCEIHCYGDKSSFLQQLSTAIREQFLAATTPSIFAVNMLFGLSWIHFDEFHLQNGIGEELHGERTKSGAAAVLITRGPTNTNCKLYLQEWIKRISNKKCNGRIEIYRATVGSLVGAYHMDMPNMNEERDDQQPSTSKQA